MPNYSSPSSTPWWKKVISNQWIMGALIGFVIGTVFFYLPDLLSQPLAEEGISIHFYRVMLLTIYWLTGIAVYRILKEKHWVVKIASIIIIREGLRLGAFVMAFFGVYRFLGFIYYLDTNTKISDSTIDIVSEGYMSIVPNLIMLLILFIGAWLSNMLINLVYQLFKLPKQRLTNR